MAARRDVSKFVSGLVVVVAILVFWRVKSVSSNHEGLCPHPAGYSLGSQHFCGHERCSHTAYPHGLGLFQAGGNDWGNPGPGHTREVLPGTPLIGVTVTQISVNNVVLKGWFHIRLDIPADFPLYLLYVSVVTEENYWWLPTGEFTTDLLNRCDGVSLDMTPTQSELLPCGSTYWSSVIHPNSVLFSREALVEGNHPGVPGPIPRPAGVARNITTTPEFHMNWKMTPGSACVNARTVRVRVSALTFPAHLDHPINFANCVPPHPTVNDAQTCEKSNPYNVDPASQEPKGPRQTAHKPTLIHLPRPSLSQGFYGPDHSPPFVDANTQVNCRVAMPTVDRTTVPPPPPTPPPAPPYVEVQPTPMCSNGRLCNPPYLTRAPGVPIASKMNCNLPAMLVPTDSRAARPLYHGRCIKSPFAGFPLASGQLHVNFGLQCEPPEAEDQPFTNALPTMEQYIEHFRFDTCNCDGRRVRVDNGTLDFEPLDGRPLRTTPAPDYPVPDNIGGVGRQSPEELGTDSGTNATRTAQRLESSEERILKMVKRARTLHGALYAVAFLVVIPASIFVIRYLKESFCGHKLLVYEYWYSFHVLAVVFVFVLMLPAQVIIYGGQVWAKTAEPVELTEAEQLHVTIGWAVIGIYGILLCTGGIRCYSPNSTFGLKVSIWFHGILGYVFFYLGHGACAVVMIGSGHGFAAIVQLGWVGIDLVFHVVMTCHVALTDKVKFPMLQRPMFPVMAYIIYDRNAPGRPFRMAMFGLSLALNIWATVTIVEETIRTGGFTNGNSSIYRLKASLHDSRQNRH